MDRLVIDMEKVFEDGQVYVACSRTRTLGGLAVVGDFPIKSTKCSPLALAEMKRLRDAPPKNVSATRQQLQSQLRRERGSVVVDDPFLRPPDVARTDPPHSPLSAPVSMIFRCKFCQKEFQEHGLLASHESKAKCHRK